MDPRPWLLWLCRLALAAAAPWWFTLASRPDGLPGQVCALLAWCASGYGLLCWLLSLVTAACLLLSRGAGQAGRAATLASRGLRVLGLSAVLGVLAAPLASAHVHVPPSAGAPASVTPASPAQRTPSPAWPTTSAGAGESSDDDPSDVAAPTASVAPASNPAPVTGPASAPADVTAPVPGDGPATPRDTGDHGSPGPTGASRPGASDAPASGRDSAVPADPAGPTSSAPGAGWPAAPSHTSTGASTQQAGPDAPERDAPAPSDAAGPGTGVHPLADPSPSAPGRSSGGFLPAPEAPDLGRAWGGARTADTDVVIVREGDSLWSLAARHLGPAADAGDIAAEWPRWYRLNAEVIGADPDLLLVGTRLFVPQ
ncbi:LysM domain-containing protein [Galactobacter valiniphilus]|nr:LysM domain-containing protein [Galactobacter valiniphilus]